MYSNVILYKVRKGSIVSCELRMKISKINDWKKVKNRSFYYTSVMQRLAYFHFLEIL